MSAKTAVVAFVPVIHKGYIDFFTAHPGDVFFFGDEIIRQFVHLTRDLRVMPEGQTLAGLRAIFPDRDTQPLTVAALQGLNGRHIVMPDDEVCHAIAEKHLGESKIEFVPVFLRWNRVITLKENEIDPKRKISNEAFRCEFMARGFGDASKSEDWWRQVGAVVVKGGKALLSSHNRHMPSQFNLETNGDPRSNFDAGQHIDMSTAIHAEASLIAEAAQKGISLDGSEIYVTTFPCPNCARLIATAGIKRVFYSKGYSLLDAERILEHFGVEIVLVQ